MNKLKPIMELLIVTVNKKMQDEVTSIIKKHSYYSLNFQSFGSLENNNSFWNFDIIEQHTIISIVPVQKTKEILIELQTKLNLNKKHHGIAFTIPFDSASKSFTDLFKKEVKK